MNPADKRTTYGDRFEDYPAGHPDTWYAASDTATVNVLAAADTVTRSQLRTYVAPSDNTTGVLRTVAMPDLRSPDARTLDAARRGLDCRTADDKTRAELVRLVDALQALTLRVEELERGRG